MWKSNKNLIAMGCHNWTWLFHWSNTSYNNLKRRLLQLLCTHDSLMKHPEACKLSGKEFRQISKLQSYDKMNKLLSCKNHGGSSKQLTIKPVIVWLVEQLREIPDRCVCTKQAYLFFHICFPITVLVLHQSKTIQFKYLQAQTIHQVLIELVTSAKDGDESDWAENSSKTSTNTLQNF